MLILALVAYGAALVTAVVVSVHRLENSKAEWSETVRCVRVIDGDTIEIENGVRVRLVGVEAFEVRNGTRLDREAAAAGISPDEALGRGHEQAEALRRRIEGKDVVLRYRFYPTDRYGRRLGELVEGE